MNAKSPQPTLENAQTRHAIIKSAVCASLLHLSPPLPAVALGAADLRVAPPPVTDSAAESPSVLLRRLDAVRSLRALLFTSPDAKIMAQSEDRRYMRVDFSEPADLFSVGLDSGPVLPRADGQPRRRGGRAVPAGAREHDGAHAARRAAQLRLPVAAAADAARRARLGAALVGQRRPERVLRAAQRRVPLEPARRGRTRLPRGSDAQLDALREQADEDFEWPPSAFPKPPPPERRNRPL